MGFVGHLDLQSSQGGPWHIFYKSLPTDNRDPAAPGTQLGPRKRKGAGITKKGLTRRSTPILHRASESEGASSKP